jgi:quercetin dioxygenase-like cupin family protein
MKRSNNFIIESTVEWEQINKGMRRQVLGYDNKIMMVKIEFLAGGEGSVHSHVHSQCSYIVSGVFEFNIDGIKKVVKAGDGLYMEPNIPHGVNCQEAGILIDTFSPVRADFLK